MPYALRDFLCLFTVTMHESWTYIPLSSHFFLLAAQSVDINISMALCAVSHVSIKQKSPVYFVAHLQQSK